MKIVILGLGNELLGDEGVGVHAARQLQNVSLPETTSVVEVGTAILDALPFFEEADGLIVIDAMMDGKAPGTVYHLPLHQCSGAHCIASMHGFDIFRTMALAERTEQPEVTVFGVEPEMIGWSLELSTVVSRSMDALLGAVTSEVFRMGKESTGV